MTAFRPEPPAQHCQICGRAIRAPEGLIAHHGYRRPGSGWQTSSCWGARHVPYEQGHDALDKLLIYLRHRITTTQDYIVEWRRDPDKQIKWQSRNGFNQPTGTPLTFVRPEPWSIPPQQAARRSHSTAPADYAELWHAQLRQYQTMLKSLQSDLKQFTARRDAWVAPKPITLEDLGL